MGSALLKPITHSELANFFCQTLNKAVINARLNQQAVRTDAGLARVTKLGYQRTINRLIKIGIVENDDGRIAPQLHRSSFDGIGALLHQEFSNRSRPRERQLANNRIGGHFSSDIR